MSAGAAGAAPPLVAHVIYALGTGGLENGLVNIINRCPPARYRHAIICLSHATAFAGRICVPGVELIELHKRPGHDPRMYWRLWRTLRRLRPAVVHTRNLAALETQVLGLFMPGVRRVHGEHGRDVSDLHGRNPRYRLLRRALQPLIGRFITVSRDLARWLEGDVGIPRHKVVQIYNGVDHERFRAPPALPAALPPAFRPGEGRVIVGTVGRLAAVKDQQLLLRALDRIFRQRRAMRPRLRCIVVGDGPEREALLRLVAERGLDDAVFFAGDCSDVPAWLAAMDLFVLPSLGEGISNTVLEAMAAGLPVVATAVGGNPELVAPGVNGSLVPAADASALAAALSELAADPALRRRMGAAGRRRVQERFDWSRTVDRYLGVYDELLRS